MAVNGFQESTGWNQLICGKVENNVRQPWIGFWTLFGFSCAKNCGYFLFRAIWKDAVDAIVGLNSRSRIMSGM